MPKTFQRHANSEKTNLIQLNQQPFSAMNVMLHHANSRQQVRLFSTTRAVWNASGSGHQPPTPKLTHIDDATGKARMVDVNHKTPTERLAVASAVVHVGAEIARQIEQNSVKKGDVLSIAQIAGIIGAKRTAEIIPLCHNIPISAVVVNTVLNLTENCVNIRATVKCEGKTGVEMEALCAVTTAALTIYDMCKALSKDITISDIKLLKKSGGKQFFQRAGYVDWGDQPSSEGKSQSNGGNEEIVIQNYNTEPIVTKEPFYPTPIWNAKKRENKRSEQIKKRNKPIRMESSKAQNCCLKSHNENSGQEAGTSFCFSLIQIMLIIHCYQLVFTNSFSFGLV